MSEAFSRTGANAASKLTTEFMIYLGETLKENPRMAHSLANEIIPLFQEAKERQIYKLIYPFVAN